MYLNEFAKLNRDFKDIIKKYSLIFITLILIYISISFSSVYPTRLLGNIIDLLTSDGGLTEIVLKTLFLYIFIRILNLILNFISRYVNEKIKVNLESNLRVESINKLLETTNLNELKSLQSSQYVTRINDAIKALVEAILNIILWLGKSLPILLFTFYFIMKINYIIGLLILPFIYIMALFTKYISKKLKTVSVEELKRKSIAIDFTYEIIESFETIRIYNIKNYILNKYIKNEDNWNKSRVDMGILSSISFLSLSIFGILITSLILILSSGGNSIIRPGEITSLILYTGNIFILIMDVFNNIIVFSELDNSLKRFNDIFSNNIEEYNIIDRKIENWDIECKDISFSYDEISIINNLSFRIKEGMKVGIVGSNGTGKSTILKLLSGLYRPNSGRISFSNIPIEDIDSLLINNLSYGQQEPYIYNDNIYNNINLDNIYNKNHIEEIFKLFNIDEIINKIGENTILYNNGANLSGGQRQKIGLARTVLKNPKILLLDEFTNSLDLESQNRIFNYLINTDKTIICITHDFKYIDKFDLIIYLDGSGNHAIDSHKNLMKNVVYSDFIYGINDI